MLLLCGTSLRVASGFPEAMVVPFPALPIEAKRQPAYEVAILEAPRCPITQKSQNQNKKLTKRLCSVSYVLYSYPMRNVAEPITPEAPAREP